jgi:hypothetical protein
MENDSIRASGTNTLVDIWIDGKLRGIGVSQEAIGAYLGFEQASGMTDHDRCEFVRAHLPLILTAARARLQETNPAADTVMIDVGQLPRPDSRSGDRRKTERRKVERRKAERARPDQIDRRRRARRQGERRAKPPKPE